MRMVDMVAERGGGAGGSSGGTPLAPASAPPGEGSRRDGSTEWSAAPRPRTSRWAAKPAPAAVVAARAASAHRSRDAAGARAAPLPPAQHPRRYQRDDQRHRERLEEG